MLNTMHQTERWHGVRKQGEQSPTDHAAHPTVVVVDTDQAVLQLMEDLLHTEGYTTHSFAGYKDHDLAIQQLSPDLVILDAHPRHARALIAMVHQLRRTPHLRTTPIIIDSTDKRMLETVSTSLENIGCYTFEKPFDITVFLEFIEAVLGTTPACDGTGSYPYMS